MGERFQAVSFSAAFPRSVTGAMTSSLNICAFILCFSVVVRLLTLSGLLGAAAQLLSSLPPPLALSPAWSRRLLVGALELSSGVYSLTDGSLTGRLSMAAFMLGWAGVSVHLQVLAFLGDSGLSMRTYLTGKLLHGGLSALLMGALAPRLAPPCPSPLVSFSRPRPSPAGRPPRSGPVRRRSLGAVAVLFGSGGISQEKSSGKAQKIAL